MPATLKLLPDFASDVGALSSASTPAAVAQSTDRAAPWTPAPASEPAFTEIPIPQSIDESRPVDKYAQIADRLAEGLDEFGLLLAQYLLPPLTGFGALIVLWLVVGSFTPELPSPVAVFDAAVKVFAQPFYTAGPNDVGIGFKILNSLARVAMGFGLAAVVGIPLGFLTGRSVFFGRTLGPLITLLRPVSPLAWLPIGLLVFKGANPAAIWTIFICSIWPMIINTAVGVQRVPQDYMNVAKVLNLSEWKITTKILLPSVLPYVLTGVRLAVGTAWLVIVAAEMLTGGVGIGFWVWDEWNNLNVANIVVAILVIGVVGLILELSLIQVAKAFTYEDVKQ